MIQKKTFNCLQKSQYQRSPSKRKLKTQEPVSVTHPSHSEFIQKFKNKINTISKNGINDLLLHENKPNKYDHLPALKSYNRPLPTQIQNSSINFNTGKMSSEHTQNQQPIIMIPKKYPHHLASLTKLKNSNQKQNHSLKFNYIDDEDFKHHYERLCKLSKQ